MGKSSPSLSKVYILSRSYSSNMKKWTQSMYMSAVIKDKKEGKAPDGNLEGVFL